MALMIYSNPPHLNITTLDNKHCPICSDILVTEMTIQKTITNQCINCELNHYFSECECDYEYTKAVIITCHTCINKPQKKNSNVIYNKLRSSYMSDLRTLARNKRIKYFQTSKDELVRKLVSITTKEDFPITLLVD